MKILFDNGTPKPIARSLAGHEVSYARQIGWHELENGELIERAEQAGFELLLSTDKNIQYQQNGNRNGRLFSCASTGLLPRWLSPCSYVQLYLPFT